jgi:hypothetical protein
MRMIIKIDGLFRRERDPHVAYLYTIEITPGRTASWSAHITRNGEMMGTATGTIKHPPHDEGLLSTLAESEVVEIIETRYSLL